VHVRSLHQTHVATCVSRQERTCTCVSAGEGERGEGDEGVGVRETGRIQFGMRPVLLDANRLGLELFVGGFGAFVEAFDDAAELHGRYVRSCRTRCAGEGERVL
jgi:hypothetical protein